MRTHNVSQVAPPKKVASYKVAHHPLQCYPYSVAQYSVGLVAPPPQQC